jgi:hypothetical protein
MLTWQGVCKLLFFGFVLNIQCTESEAFPFQGVIAEKSENSATIFV